MPHLTRHIFRRILANEAILHRGCLRRQQYSLSLSQSPRNSRNGLQIPSRPQRRTFFNFNMFAGRKKRDSQEPDMDPGLEDMMLLAKLERMRARLPPPEDVASAFRKLFEHKRDKTAILEDTQAQLALQSLRYCSRMRAERAERGEEVEGLIGEGTLNKALDVLGRGSQVETAPHADLAKAVYEELLALDCPVPTKVKALRVYVRSLACSGHALEARQILLDYEASFGDGELAEVDPADKQKQLIQNTIATSWSDILHGFSLGHDEPELLATLALLRDRNLHEGHRVKSAMLSFYLRTDNVDAVKAWYADRARFNAYKPQPAAIVSRTPKELHQVLQWCLKHNELDFGHQIVRDVTTDNPTKPIWDAIFVWAAGTGKGPDEINRMFSVMEASNKNIPEKENWRTPDISTINALIEFAISKNDPYLAERYISIGKARNIEPDARTYVLQMQYRLKVSDIDGALTAYANSQAMDLSSNEDVPTVNDLLVALCNSKRHDFDTIMNVAADLSDRQARFEANTVSHLSLLHLSRDELHDVIDLLNTHAFHYSRAERSLISQEILSYALDPRTPTSRTWDAYTILRSIFDEIPREPRTVLMQEFLRRERADMAVHVFNGMRSHSRPDTLPTAETYISAFLGSAKYKDLESLEVVHNQLKLDFNIDASTRLYNALIKAYTECGQPGRALRFWDDIAASREGPTYSSLLLTFQACEKAPFGDLKARELWGKLGRMGVERDQGLWASYVAALAGNGDNSYVMAELERGEREGEVEVSVEVLGALVNGCPTEGKQGVVEGWGRERWPGVWEELEGAEWRELGNGKRIYRVGEGEVDP